MPDHVTGCDADSGVEELIGRVLARGHRLHELSTRLDEPNPLLDVTLTMQQLKVLVAVARGADSGHQLTRLLRVSMATVTGLVDRLAAAGMVSRREDPTDRRVRRVELTAAGRQLLDRLSAAGDLATRRLLSYLDADGLRTVERAMELLCSAAERAAASVPPP